MKIPDVVRKLQPIITVFYRNTQQMVNHWKNVKKKEGKRNLNLGRQLILTVCVFVMWGVISEEVLALMEVLKTFGTPIFSPPLGPCMAAILDLVSAHRAGQRCSLRSASRAVMELG